MTANRPIDRLLEYLLYRNISHANAEKALSLSNGYIRNATLRAGGGIGSDILDKIYRTFLDINLIWLITGVGEMLISGKNDDQTPIANRGIAATLNTDVTITPIGKLGTKTQKGLKPAPPTAPPNPVFEPKVITVDREGNNNIVFVPVKAAAGYLNGFGDPEFIENLPSFTLPGLNKSAYRAFEVSGDSMSPTLENKEIVVGQWVDGLEYIREDHVHIVVTKNHGVVVKRLLNRLDKYGYIIAKSDALDNRNLYPNIEIYPEDITEIWFAVTHLNWKFKHPTDMYKRVNNIEADLTEVLRVLKEKQLL